MNDSGLSNNDSVKSRKRQNSEDYLHNPIVSSKTTKIDHSPNDLPNNSSKSKSHGSSQALSSKMDIEHKINSENTFQKPIISNGDYMEEKSLSKLELLSPATRSIHLDDKSSLDLNAPDTPLISDNEKSPDIIDGSELKKNIVNYTPVNASTSSYSTIQKSIESSEAITWSRYRDVVVSQKPIPLNDRLCPLPTIPWGKHTAFWKIICDKDSNTLTYRNHDYHEYQEQLAPRMRAILLEWLMDVSCVYKIHRETYYLSMDYLDRYLSNSNSVLKEKLQLIGITCLFIAAKVEEIYPPKASDFAYVTDDSCSVNDIFETEKMLLTYLHFRLTPISINYWMEMMLQFICIEDNTSEDSIIIAQFPEKLFNQMAHLLDFATLDFKSLRYSYSELAASALSIVFNKKIALIISGLSEGNICICIEWMTVYWSIILEEHDYEEIDIENDWKLVDGDHVKQKHLVNMDMYDLAQTRFELIESAKVKSPVTSLNLLTPPWSGNKHRETAEDCKPSCSYK